MTREEYSIHKELIEAWGRGEEIEFCDARGDWWVVENPHWDSTTKYRIKSQPEYIPFDFSDAKQLIGKVVKAKDGSVFFIIGRVGEVSSITLGSKKYSYRELLEEYTFLDGSPCGKLKP